MRPRRQDLNIIFFTFRSCRQLDGRQGRGQQASIFENFPIRYIFLKFCFFLNIKMKKVRVSEAALGFVAAWAPMGRGGIIRCPRPTLTDQPASHARTS